ncbi:unnamed protein product [Rotaria sp. Silwood1]|nr:unnamed protein product [Rotaria sp. Silwood1]
MVDIQHQHQCSSKAIAYNTTMFYKQRKTYLIIDIEPIVDDKPLTNDESYPSIFKDNMYTRPNEDTSINNIIFGIGLVVVILLLLLIFIKLIYKCYKMYHSDDDDKNEKDQVKRSPLLPSSTSVVVRRNSSIRNPTPSMRRSSLLIETQMDITQIKRLSQTYNSISWDGTPFIKQELFNTIDVLKDASVTVRPTTSCKCQNIEAKIVDPNTMLLKNLDTKGYFYADSRSIEYTSVRPDEGGTTLRFEFKKKNTNYTGTLSYLMRGISWSPNYDLFIKDENTCSLRAYANIRNNQQQEYQVDNTYLYSGDIPLVNNYPPVMSYPMMMKGAAEELASSPSIQLDGEQKGFYFYSLKDKYTLHAKSSIRLPFIIVNPTCKFYYKTTTSISSGQYKGVFQRNYDIISDQFLPAGTLTIRDNQVLMGQSSLPDVPVNYSQMVTLGQDNDVRYSVKGNITASNKDTTTITWQTYELNVTIFNYKDKDVNGQLDFYGAPQTHIDKTTCNSTSVDGTTINLPFQVKKGDNYQCRITVTLTWG